ncbi:hypothetical protein Ddye_024084 [Dipteronia dyeriana]|uniref:Uncharacterized protein n=1 Tax=Dipteronia dyeriana TaxID=168575 RepID=A0AAD9TUS4_9ROSI|nr:hypothetical protein Ddye_024084 [Dipteronia dyeriana]
MSSIPKMDPIDQWDLNDLQVSIDGSISRSVSSTVQVTSDFPTAIVVTFPLYDLIDQQAEQLDELRKQLERERNLKFEEASKECDNVDAITSKAMSIKEAGAAKLQELDNKAEEIVKQVHSFCSSADLCMLVSV